MQIEQVRVFINNEIKLVNIKKFEEKEIEQKIFKFCLEDFFDETKYIPKVVSLCYHYSLAGTSYQDMLELYYACVEVNPPFDYKFYSPNIKRILLPPPSASSQNNIRGKEKEQTKPEEKKNMSLEEIASIMDFGDLEKSWNEVVIGQEEAIKQLLRPLISVKHIGLPEKGTMSFYLMGPSGVGKTSSIEFLSRALDLPLLYIQGSEYQEEHTARKLFGAPPSYIGYDPDGGILAKFFKENSASIILWDEIDKVNPKIYGALTSFLGDGFVTNQNGEKIYFKGWNFFTSNTGNKASESGMGRDIGFKTGTIISDAELEKQRIINILKKQGVGEAFLGRMNGFVRFEPLDNLTLGKILDKNINESNEKLKHYKIELTESAKEEIIQSGDPNSWGARNLLNNLDRFAISELSYEFEMKKNILEGSRILVDFEPVNKKFRYYLGENIVREIASL